MSNWLDLFMLYLAFSMMSVGGAITTPPEMRRYLIDPQHCLSDAQSNLENSVGNVQSSEKSGRLWFL